ncbi:hypothetical protein CTI12_AA290800 [Artemisia annua]|uniref:Uncharacterized protein n=1 Tax=Artemisia annua TaxID=35608 RepID=A0A2U1N7I3_ARTAN|nr:hypothetical protein CTI12_AA290800 [Artemisia annua]
MVNQQKPIKPFKNTSQPVGTKVNQHQPVKPAGITVNQQKHWSTSSNHRFRVKLVYKKGDNHKSSHHKIGKSLINPSNTTISSSKPDIIDISSDSSSAQSASSGWNNYFPLNPSTASSKKGKKKVREATPSEDLLTPPPYVNDSSSSELNSMPSYVSSYHSDDEEKAQPPPLAVILTSEIEKAVSSMSTISVPVNTQPHPKPGKQVLGLPNKQVWNAIKDRGIDKSMPAFKGKGKRSLE